MDNKEFDDIVRKKLESLSSGSTDDGWELFREKWEQSNSPVDSSEQPDSQDEVDPNTDELFDAKVKENMKGLRMPFNSEHWVRLKAQLESEALFKKRLFAAKTVEILMLSLIVLCVVTVWPFQTDIYEIPIDDAPMIASIQVDKATADNYSAKQLNKKVKAQQLISQISNNLSEFITNPFITKPIALQNKTNTNNINQNRSYLKPLRSINESKTLEFIPFYNITRHSSHRSTPQETEDNKDGITTALSRGINLLDIPQRPMGYPDLSIGNSKKKSDEKTFVSIGFGPKINLINSPFDPVYEIDAYNTLNTNFNISAKIHKEVGPIEMYTGLGFTNTSYKPLIIKEVYQNQRNEFNHASLENIAHKTFNIPVGINYDIIDNENLKVYTSAGMDVNIVTHSDYEVYDVPANNTGSRYPNSIVNQELSKIEINSRALLSQKEFSKGVAQGGEFRDNLYASANIGLGIVKNVSDNVSLYLEPKYSHFITSQGIGPNLDKLHAVSIDVGIKLELN